MIELHVQPSSSSNFANLLFACALVGIDSPVAEWENFLWVPHPRECWHCGEPCQWIDLDFEAALHPGVCERAKWAEYFEALRRRPLDKSTPPE